MGWNVTRVGVQVGRAADWAVATFARPDSVADVALTCVVFFVSMSALCCAVEVSNTKRGEKARWAQCKQELSESVLAVVFSTCYSLGWLKWAYPLRWGFVAPIFPNSFGGALVEAVVWLSCFEVVAYFVHRTLHMRKPINIYQFHHPHHVFHVPTSFAAQAIHWAEALIFAQAANVVSLFWPVSVFTQYVFGVFLLAGSVFAHDSEGVLDRGFHYEHHHHFEKNFGFLGIMDVVCDTVYYGRAYDGADSLAYASRMLWFRSWMPWKQPLAAQAPTGPCKND